MHAGEKLYVSRKHFTPYGGGGGSTPNSSIPTSIGSTIHRSPDPPRPIPSVVPSDTCLNYDTKASVLCSSPFLCVCPLFLSVTPLSLSCLPAAHSRRIGSTWRHSVLRYVTTAPLCVTLRYVTTAPLCVTLRYDGTTLCYVTLRYDGNTELRYVKLRRHQSVLRYVKLRRHHSVLRYVMLRRHHAVLRYVTTAPLCVTLRYDGTTLCYDMASPELEPPQLLRFRVTCIGGGVNRAAGSPEMNDG